MDKEYVLKYVEVNGDKATYIVHGYVSRSDCRTKSQYKEG